MKEITVDTVQGIGDLIWVYRKLSSVYDKINLNILAIDKGPIQTRAKQFIETLSKIGSINYKVVTSNEYMRVAAGLYATPLVDGEYSVNAWLERGIHIENIDDYPVSWDIGLKFSPVATPKKYVLLYVSGCSHNLGYYQMSSEEWAYIAVSACQLVGVDTCILIGAQFDGDKLNEIRNLIGAKVKTYAITDYTISQTSYLIKNAEYFIAYQSGLCMIAEEIGKHTLMVWFPHLAPMTSTWIRRNHLAEQLIMHTFFGMNIENIIEAIKRHVVEIKRN
jgi:hypothetical protein